MTRDSIPRLQRFTINPNHIIWAIYAALLAALIPHTQWFFQRFEPAGWMGWLWAYALAIVFELALGVFTHELARHNNTVSDDAAWHKKYVNVYGIGLTVAWFVSTIANVAHSFEYAFADGVKPLVIADGIPWLMTLYVISAGAVLPLMSALFAGVLSSGQTVSMNRAISAPKSVSNDTSQPKPKRAKKRVSTVSKPSKIDTAIEMIHARPDTPLTQLADESGISLTTFNRAKKMNGKHSEVTG